MQTIENNFAKREATKEIPSEMHYTLLYTAIHCYTLLYTAYTVDTVYTVQTADSS